MKNRFTASERYGSTICVHAQLIRKNGIRMAALLLGTIACLHTATAQKSASTLKEEMWATGGPFAGYTPAQEVLEKRTKNAKHFRNANGSFTVQTGDVYHYKNAQGMWQDIDLTIQQESPLSFVNETNELKSYFTAKADHQAVKMQLNDQVAFSWWTHPQLSLSVNGNVVATSQPAAIAGNSDRNILTYPAIYPGISEEFVTLKNGVENNTIIHSLSNDINALPQNALLEFSQFIPLQSGWKIDVRGAVKSTDFTCNDFHIAIPQTEMGIYFSPVIVFDHSLTRNEALYIQYAPAEKLTATELQHKQNNTYQCKYDVHFVNGGINITTKMPAAWLKTAGRSFPVTIDPTVTVTPSPVYAGGYFYSPMSHWYGFQRHADLYLASEIGVSNVNISDIEYERMSTSGTNAVKPAKVYMRTTTSTALSGTDAWNSATYTGGLTPLYNSSADFHGTTTGWKMISLTTPFLYASDNLLVMVYDEYGGSGSAKYLNISNAFASARQAFKRQDGTDPGDASATAVESKLAEIRITYTSALPTSPACITAPLTPANGATGICSGTTILRWNKAATATGYDVYFNTGTTATTIVSTNQADTFYNAATGIGSYAWKIVPKNAIGAATGCATFTFTTVAGITPAVSMTVGPNDTLCPAVTATFTATPTNGGAAPTYQWKKNNVNVGTNSPVYSDNTLVNNDAVYVIMTSNSTGCLSTPSATSNTQVMTILPAPVAIVTASGPLKFCRGGSVTLTVPAGATSYQWASNAGNLLGATTNTYTAAFTGNYTVVAQGTSNCPSVSDTVRVVSYPLPVPLLTHVGNTLTTTTDYIDYQWFNGSAPIAGATTNTYTYTHDGDYSVLVTDTLGCAGTSFVFPVHNLSVGQIAAGDINIYPNPASTILTISSPVKVNAAIRSIDGKVVLQQAAVHTLDISLLSNGIYMLYITDQQGVLLKVEKLVKKAD